MEIIPFDDYNHRLHPGTDIVGSVLPTWGNHALTNGWKLLLSDMSKLYRIRKLIPMECFRLMGVKDEDFQKMKNAGISDSQLYKLAGNSIVVDVLEAIFRNLNFTEQPLRVFEAFAGYGSQSMALRNIGVEHEVVGISEIDKYAIMAYNATHEPTTNFGDISKIEWGGVPNFDFFTYSFPCTDISNAGAQAGFEEGSGTRAISIILLMNSYDHRRIQGPGLQVRRERAGNDCRRMALFAEGNAPRDRTARQEGEEPGLFRLHLLICR